MQVRPMTAADLAREECASYWHGTCGGCRPCAVEAGQTCPYFEQVVLPLHPDVTGYGEPASSEVGLTTRRCERCRAEYFPTGRHSRYCPACLHNPLPVPLRPRGVCVRCGAFTFLGAGTTPRKGVTQ